MRHAERHNFLLFILIFSFLAVFVFSLCVGRYPLTLGDIGKIFMGAMDDPMKRSVFLRIRLPRAVFASLTGAALASSGAVCQELFHNPLASPDVLGAGSGASVGAVAAIVFGGGTILVRAASMIGGLLAVGAALALARNIGRGRELSSPLAGKTVGLVLSGMAVKALSDAAVMALKYFADPARQLPTIDYWLMGSFQSARAAEVWYFLPFALLPMGVLYLLRWQIAVLSMGEEEAKSLGMRVGAVRVCCLLLACVSVAASTAVTGVVSWVGLLVPHMVRRWEKAGIAAIYVPCAWAGAVFLLLADTAARSLTSAEIPVSIFTSFCGALFLLCHGRRGERGNGRNALLEMKPSD